MANEASYYSLAKSLGLCGLSACIAEAATLPLDTAKVRFGLSVGLSEKLFVLSSLKKASQHMVVLASGSASTSES
jgi:hypothetical protein